MMAWTRANADPNFSQALDVAYVEIQVTMDEIRRRVEAMRPYAQDGNLSHHITRQQMPTIPLMSDEQLDRMEAWAESNYRSLKDDLAQASTLKEQQKAVMEMIGANFRLYELQGLHPISHDIVLAMVNAMQASYEELRTTDEIKFSVHNDAKEFEDIARYMGMIGTACETIAALLDQRQADGLLPAGERRQSFAELACDQLLSGEQRQTGYIPEEKNGQVVEYARKLMEETLRPYCKSYSGSLTPEFAALIGKGSLTSADMRPDPLKPTEDFEAPLYSPHLSAPETKNRVNLALSGILHRYGADTDPHCLLEADQTLDRLIGGGPGSGRRSA